MRSVRVSLPWLVYLQQRCTYSETSANALYLWTGISCVYSHLVCLLYSLVLGYGEMSLLRYSAYDGLYTLTDLLMFAAIYRRRSSPVEDLPSTILRCVAANIDRSYSCKRYSWLHRLCYGGLSDQEVTNFAITFPCSLLDWCVADTQIRVCLFAAAIQSRSLI